MIRETIILMRVEHFIRYDTCSIEYRWQCYVMNGIRS